MIKNVTLLALLFSVNSFGQNTNNNEDPFYKDTVVEKTCISKTVYCREGNCQTMSTITEKVTSQLQTNDRYIAPPEDGNVVSIETYSSTESYQYANGADRNYKYSGVSKTFFENGKTLYTSDASIGENVSDSDITVYKSTYTQVGNRYFVDRTEFYKYGTSTVNAINLKQNIVLTSDGYNYDSVSLDSNGSVNRIKKVTCTEKLLSAKDYRWSVAFVPATHSPVEVAPRPGGQGTTPTTPQN